MNPWGTEAGGAGKLAASSSPGRNGRHDDAGGASSGRLLVLRGRLAEVAFLVYQVSGVLPLTVSDLSASSRDSFAWRPICWMWRCHTSWSLARAFM
jgi:hypothetical protein